MPERPLEQYATFINKLFEPQRSLSLDILGDAQKSQLFMDTVDRALHRLPHPRDRWVLELRYGLLDERIRSYKAIGTSIPRLRGMGIGVSIESVRQIEAKAMRRLRHPNRSAELRQFLIDNPPPIT